jgi:hypothetical protein
MSKQHEEATSDDEPELDLNALRDRALAGEERAHFDFSKLSKDEFHALAHFVNPDLHPDFDPGPPVDELRKIARQHDTSDGDAEDSARQSRERAAPPHSGFLQPTPPCIKLGYLVCMINETYDTYPSTPAPFFYWEPLVNGKPSSAGIDSHLRNAGDVRLLSRTLNDIIRSAKFDAPSLTQ